MRERIFAIIRKELSQMFRNRRTRVFLFVPPLFQLIIFGYAVNLDVDNLRMGWMDMDQRRKATTCWRLSRDPDVSCSPLPQNEREIQELLDRGTCR